jgi:large conductance mechanosensitive channel
MKKLTKQFQEFITRGNVIDLAVGVMIGGAFTAIVNSLASNLFMPLIGLITGGVDFDALTIMIGSTELHIGNILTALINFLIIALILFAIIKVINRMYSSIDEEKTKTIHKCPFCCKKVNIDATRCPHCTSEISPLSIEVVVDDKLLKEA